MNSNRTSPSSPSSTVKPEKNTARPAVARCPDRVLDRVGGQPARASSSRKRLVMSSE